jgi:hypothetical protein
MGQRFEIWTEGWSNTSLEVFHVIDTTQPYDWNGEPNPVFSSENESEAQTQCEQLNQKGSL